MSWAEVQTANFANADSGSLGSNVAAGDSVLLHVTSFSESNVTITSSAPTFNGVDQTATSTKLWEDQSAFIGGFTVYTALWLMKNLAGGAASVGITVTNGTLNTAVGLQATEYSGGGTSPTIDNTNSPMPSTGFSNTTALSSGTTGATTSASDLVVGGGCDGNGGITAGDGTYTNTAVMGGATVFGWKTPGATGTYSYATTGASGGNSVFGCVAIKSSAGGGTAHNASASLSLTPTFTADASVTEAHRTATASLALTPTFTADASVSGAGHSATASLALTPTFTADASVTGAHTATASLAVTPSFSAHSSGGAAKQVQGPLQGTATITNVLMAAAEAGNLLQANASISNELAGTWQ